MSAHVEDVEVAALPRMPPAAPRHDTGLSEKDIDEKSFTGSVPFSDPKSGDGQQGPGLNIRGLGDDYEDVWADKRVLDLDETGKERPIETSFDWSARLISLNDDPTEPVWTFRMWFIALGLGCFGAVLSEIFAFRPQTLYVSALFIQVISYLMGNAAYFILPGPGNPAARLRTADTRFWRWINPGLFNIKEHTAILIMSTAATHGALAINILAAQDLFYNHILNPGNAIFLLLGSQLIGYGLAGMMRSFLVYPTHMVFPNLVPTVQMMDLLHRGQHQVLQKKRMKFFWSVFCFILVWEFFPEYIAPTLTGISIFCLADRKSAWVTRIFGGAAGNEGLGMFSINLDWNYIGSGGGAYGALFQPLSTQMSMYFGVGLCIIAFCWAYNTNAWKAQNFPFLSQLLFNEDGTRFNQTLILNPDFTLNQTALNDVGLPWYAATQTIGSIGTSLAFGATLTHIICWHSKQMLGSWKAARSGTIDDPHYLKMAHHRECPWWWWAAVYVLSAIVGMVTCYTGKSQLPWWGFIVALLFSAFFLPIIATLYATVVYVPTTENVAQMICAAMLPGKPVANMYFSLYAYNTTEQGRSMARDMKLGQYVKLAPRATFTMQCLGSVIGALLNYVLMKIIVKEHRELLLSVQGSNVWSGSSVQAFNSDSLSWGALAKELYAPSSRYGIIPLSIFIGLIIPLPLWFAHKRWPNLGANRVVTPMLCWALGYLSVGINSGVFSTFLLAIFSQFYLRKYRARWFRKYNFLLSAALDGGTEVMVFIFSLALGGAGGKVITMPEWALNPTGNPDYCKRLT